MDRLLRYFLEPVHSPRHDDLHDRERDEVHLRRRHRQAGLGPIPDTEPPNARILLNPELALGEAYMDGTFVVEQGSIADALAILIGSARNGAALGASCNGGCAISPGTSANSIRAAGRRNNVAHHYDLDGRLYSLFLDADKQYSCAYFETPDTTLDDAQLAKKRHIAAKLLIERRRPRARHRFAAGAGSASISPRWPAPTSPASRCRPSSLQVANARAAEKNLTRVGEVLLQDYRDVPGRSTASCRSACSSMSASIITTTFFQALRRTARPMTASCCCIRSAAPTGPDVTSPWITKYIFPGGYIPALSEVMPAIERAGLLVCDIEILRLHYAETLKAWRERFMARREEAVRLYDERFARMWEFYLACSEMSFRKQNMMNFQIQLTKRQGVVPMTRDYIAHEEARLRGIERASGRGCKSRANRPAAIEGSSFAG